MYNDNIIVIHTGVKGMKWGVRRTKPSDTRDKRFDQHVKTKVQTKEDAKYEMHVNRENLKDEEQGVKEYYTKLPPDRKEVYKKNALINIKEIKDMEGSIMNVNDFKNDNDIIKLHNDNLETIDRISKVLEHHDAPEDNVLYHFGIKGMRWGVRRGPKSESNVSVNDLNRAKNVTDNSSKIAEEGGKITKAVGSIRATRKREDISQLTDAELKSKIMRMNLEQQYSNLSSGQISKGQAYAKSTFEIAGSALAIGSSALGIATAIKQLKGN